MIFYEDEPVSLYLKDLILLEDCRSSKQSIKLMGHPWLGKILIINDEIQHIEKYQTLYHELLVHLPATFLPSIGSALILGGGSLFAAYEVLKYPSVQKVVLCDYDYSVLKIMSAHYSHARTVLNDPRFVYINEDGRDFIRQTTLKFDLVINDCFNLAHESNWEGISYFNLLSNLCTSGGLCVDIIYRHIFDKRVTINTLSYLQSVQNVALSLVTVPEYPGILHLETIWGNSSYISQNITDTRNDFHKEILAGTRPSPFLFFSPEHVPYYFYLPPYIKNMFNL